MSVPLLEISYRPKWSVTISTLEEYAMPLELEEKPLKAKVP
jgi:hypothetical protein